MTPSSQIARFGAPLLRWGMHAGPKRASVISLLASSLLFAAGYYYWVSPAAAENTRKSKVLTELAAQNATNREVETSLPLFLDHLKRARDDYNVARTLLPDEPDVSIVLDGVQKLAARRGVTILRFKDTGQGAKAKADKLYERVVPVQILGDHQAVATFLADVASYPRLLNISDLLVSATGKAEIVDFNLVAYYAPAPKDLPTPPEIN